MTCSNMRTALSAMNDCRLRESEHAMNALCSTWRIAPTAGGLSANCGPFRWH